MMDLLFEGVSKWVCEKGKEKQKRKAAPAGKKLTLYSRLHDFSNHDMSIMQRGGVKQESCPLSSNCSRALCEV